MDVSFCVSALEEALARFGRPEIFNTDQGSQFTSDAFTGTLTAAGIRISEAVSKRLRHDLVGAGWPG
jgi:putative transposase